VLFGALRDQPRTVVSDVPVPREVEPVVAAGFYDDLRAARDPRLAFVTLDDIYA
jgi:hypothetical protein